MPIEQPEYRFTRKRLANGHLEIRVVLPDASADADIDVQGPEARKELSHWVLSSASGLATACGMGLIEAFYLIHASFVDTVDQGTILKAIRERPCTPESLSANPPAGVDSEIVRILLADLMESGAVYMDGHLKCSDN